MRLIKITAAHDVGKAIHPISRKGQIEGGIAQGIGMALMEEYHPGRTENLHDYLIPTIGDVPPIETILIEVPDPEGPFGAKGLGEHVLIPTAPAIFNAIRHATGVLVTQLPATAVPRAGSDQGHGAPLIAWSDTLRTLRNARARREAGGRKAALRRLSRMCYIAEGRTAPATAMAISAAGSCAATRLRILDHAVESGAPWCHSTWPHGMAR